MAPALRSEGMVRSIRFPCFRCKTECQRRDRGWCIDSTMWTCTARNSPLGVATTSVAWQPMYRKMLDSAPEVPEEPQVPSYDITVVPPSDRRIPQPLPGFAFGRRVSIESAIPKDDTGSSANTSLPWMARWTCGAAGHLRIDWESKSQRPHP